MACRSGGSLPKSDRFGCFNGGEVGKKAPSRKDALRNLIPRSLGSPLLTVVLDGSSSPASVAIARGGDLLGEWFSIEARAASRLLRELEGLLDRSGFRREHLEAVVAIAGPGSFTGTRLAVTLAWGMALGGVPRWATVTTFEALALGAPKSLERAVGWVPSIRGLGWCQLLTRHGDRMLPEGEIWEQHEQTPLPDPIPRLSASLAVSTGLRSTSPLENIGLGPLASCVARSVSFHSWPWQPADTPPQLCLPLPEAFRSG